MNPVGYVINIPRYVPPEDEEVSDDEGNEDYEEGRYTTKGAVTSKPTTLESDPDAVSDPLVSKLTRGFEQSKDVKRLRIVIGNNRVYSLSSRRNTLPNQVKWKFENSVAQLIFYWKPIWRNKQGKEVDFQEVRTYYKSLKREGRLRLLKHEKKVPYGPIRDIILNNEATRGFVAQLRRRRLTPYIAIQDADVVDLRYVFTHYDQILREKRWDVVSTGYAASDETHPLVILGIRIDQVIRQATAKHIPLGVYYPEPNTIIRVVDGLDTLEGSFANGEFEMPSMLKTLNRERPQISATYDASHPIFTDVATFHAEFPSIPSNTGVALWSRIDFMKMRNMRQSHFNPNRWAKSILRTATRTPFAISAICRLFRSIMSTSLADHSERGYQKELIRRLQSHPSYEYELDPQAPPKSDGLWRKLAQVRCFDNLFDEIKNLVGEELARQIYPAGIAASKAVNKELQKALCLDEFELAIRSMALLAGTPRIRYDESTNFPVHRMVLLRQWSNHKSHFRSECSKGLLKGFLETHPIHWAALIGDLEGVQWMKRMKGKLTWLANISIAARSNIYPLHCALEFCQNTILREELLAELVSQEALDSRGREALHKILVSRVSFELKKSVLKLTNAPYANELRYALEVGINISKPLLGQVINYKYAWLDIAFQQPDLTVKALSKSSFPAKSELLRALELNTFNIGGIKAKNLERCPYIYLDVIFDILDNPVEILKLSSAPFRQQLASALNRTSFSTRGLRVVTLERCHHAYLNRVMHGNFPLKDKISTIENTSDNYLQSLANILRLLPEVLASRLLDTLNLERLNDCPCAYLYEIFTTNDVEINIRIDALKASAYPRADELSAILKLLAQHDSEMARNITIEDLDECPETILMQFFGNFSYGVQLEAIKLSNASFIKTLRTAFEEFYENELLNSSESSSPNSSSISKGLDDESSEGFVDESSENGYPKTDTFLGYIVKHHYDSHLVAHLIVAGYRTDEADEILEEDYGYKEPTSLLLESLGDIKGSFGHLKRKCFDILLPLSDLSFEDPSGGCAVKSAALSSDSYYLDKVLEQDSSQFNKLDAEDRARARRTMKRKIYTSSEEEDNREIKRLRHIQYVQENFEGGHLIPLEIFNGFEFSSEEHWEVIENPTKTRIALENEVWEYHNYGPESESAGTEQSSEQHSEDLSESEDFLLDPYRRLYQGLEDSEMCSRLHESSE